MARLNPQEPQAKHGAFMRNVVIVSSAINSFLFVYVLMLGSIFYHFRDIVSGREKLNRPKKDNATENYTPRVPYPDLKNLKITKNLRYYAQCLDLDLEEYSIITKDGYVLTLHRLIDPKESIADRQAKQPILLQHGLLLCSGAWLTPGKNSLPYYFWEQGYDVWMGNNRCGFEPKHSFYTGNLYHNEKFWDWDIRVFATYDLPCIIDNVLLHKPNHSKLALVGHLQGCAQTFLMLRTKELKPYHQKIEYFFALAPAVFPGQMFHERSFIKFIHKRSPKMYDAIFGSCCFLYILGFSRRVLGTTSFFATISYIMFKYLFGWGIRNCYHDKKVLHLQFLFNVTFVSSKLMSWWLSYSVEEGFANQLQPKRDYKDGSHYAFTPVPSLNEPEPKIEPTNEDLEGQPEGSKEVADASSIPPGGVLGLLAPIEIDDSKSFFPYKQEWFAFNTPLELVPIYAFIGGEDYLVDGRRLATHMTHYERNFYKDGENLRVVEIPDYNHLDVIWSLNCIGKIGMPIVDTLKSLHEHSIPTNDGQNDDA